MSLSKKLSAASYTQLTFVDKPNKKNKDGNLTKINVAQPPAYYHSLIFLQPEIIMKNLFVAILLISANASFAAMDHNGNMGAMPSQHQTMSGQHTAQQMSQQMMNTESMRNMMTFMQQMQASMQNMSEFMEKNQMMNQMQLGEAASVMEQMSTQMHEMSKKMMAGQFDEKELSMMREQHKEMMNNMEQLEKNMKNN